MSTKDESLPYIMCFSPDVVKVTVNKVWVADARVSLPTDEVTIVVEGVKTFIVWPRHLVRIIPESQ